MTEKLDWKNHHFTSEGEINLHTASTREANMQNFTNSNFLKFESVKYISLLYRKWKSIGNKVSFKFLSFLHLLLKKFGFWIERTEY